MTDMDERKAREWWLEICADFQMGMDGVYYEAGLEMARRATLAERERAAKVCDRISADMRSHGWETASSAVEGVGATIRQGT